MILKIYENKTINTIFELEINGVKYYSYYLKEDIIKYAKMERIPNKNVQMSFEHILSTDKYEIFTYEFENVDELTKEFVEELIWNT